MSQAESKLSRNIMSALRLHEWFCFKVHGSETMMGGLPDIIVCPRGYFIGLETKMPGKRHEVSKRQAFVHDQIEASGGRVFVVCSVEEAVAVVEQFLTDVDKS